jgi:transposase
MRSVAECGTRPGPWLAPSPRRGRGRPRADAPRRGSDLARGLKNSRYALWKNPQNLTVRQGAKLEWVAKTDLRLYRADRRACAWCSS